jgi:hypothetical protein
MEIILSKTLTAQLTRSGLKFNLIMCSLLFSCLQYKNASLHNSQMKITLTHFFIVTVNRKNNINIFTHNNVSHNTKDD